MDRLSIPVLDPGPCAVRVQSVLLLAALCRIQVRVQSVLLLASPVCPLPCPKPQAVFVFLSSWSFFHLDYIPFLLIAVPSEPVLCAALADPSKRALRHGPQPGMEMPTCAPGLGSHIHTERVISKACAQTAAALAGWETGSPASWCADRGGVALSESSTVRATLVRLGTFPRGSLTSLAWTFLLLLDSTVLSRTNPSW